MIVDNKQKMIIIAVVVVLVIAAGAGYWYWQSKKAVPTAPTTTAPAITAPTLGTEIFEKTQNPVKGQVPDINPFKDQKNPFDAIYKNPFE